MAYIIKPGLAIMAMLPTWKSAFPNPFKSSSLDMVILKNYLPVLKSSFSGKIVKRVMRTIYRVP